MKTQVRGGRGGTAFAKLRERLGSIRRRKHINPDVVREDMVRQLKARFDEENKALEKLGADDWEQRAARLKTMGYLGQVLISSMRAYEEWSHEYEDDENEEAKEARQKAIDRLQAIHELAAKLPDGEGKGKDAAPPIESEGDAAAAAEESCQGGS